MVRVRSKSCLSLAEYKTRVYVYLVLEIYRVNNNGLWARKMPDSDDDGFNNDGFNSPEGKGISDEGQGSDAMQHLLSSLSTVVHPKARTDHQKEVYRVNYNVHLFTVYRKVTPQQGRPRGKNFLGTEVEGSWKLRNDSCQLTQLRGRARVPPPTAEAPISLITPVIIAICVCHIFNTM